MMQIGRQKEDGFLDKMGVAVVTLIERGHGDAAWGYTPKRIYGFLTIAGELDKAEMLRDATAARISQVDKDSWKKIEKQLGGNNG